jgi:maltose alpha-D-glucosyltransferase/alpha-amylase
VHTAIERGRVTTDELEAVHAFRARWTAQVQHTLVDAYLDEVEGTGLVPPEPDDARKLLELYVLMTSLYEVRYELANRPDWAAWPLDAIRDIATGVDA